MKLVGRGAEAVLYMSEGNLVKERIEKGYRIKEIDTVLRKRRTRRESRILSKAKRAGVPTPNVLRTEEYKIVMEFIEGRRLKEMIGEVTEKERNELAFEVGSLVGRLHSAGMIHGDLTTSNMIYRDRIYFIDFGLATHSKSVEDMAVDLHLLHQAYQSTHFAFLEGLWKNTVRGYGKEFEGCEAVLARLEKIRKRGRYSKR